MSQANTRHFSVGVNPEYPFTWLVLKASLEPVCHEFDVVVGDRQELRLDNRGAARLPTFFKKRMCDQHLRRDEKDHGIEDEKGLKECVTWPKSKERTIGRGR